MRGRIYSIESMGLVDGPGIRYVVFLQGCSIKCAFCHNPDSQMLYGGTEISSDELMKKILRFRPYFEKSGGGVTFSGGEPLLQKEFLTDMLIRCKQENIHTCIDTSGAVPGDFSLLLDNTDLVLYDVKATTKEDYKKTCGGDISVAENFIKQLNDSSAKVIVRQVIVPGINDSEEYIMKLREYIDAKFKKYESVELLPYHLMGIHKYKKAGLPEPLPGVPAMDKSEAYRLQTKFFG